MVERNLISNPSLRYRADIEGLRGFAVFFVLLLHFQAPFVSGGYIGVDIFFVLSGFLITSIIHKGAIEDKFSFFNFYNRRIKRLSPALIIVVLITTFIFTFLLLPEDYISFMRSVRDVFLFNANSRFEKDVGDYFNIEAEAMPLLHMWSLAIEWQFYFIFPVVYYTAIKYTKYPFPILIASALVSVLYSIYLTSSVGSVYFSTSARLFEFLIGGGAAYLTITKIKKHHTLGSYLALLCLVVMVFYFDAETAYPGTNAFIVAAAVFAILITGHNNKLLNHKIMTAMGRLSYSAYLWHWPIAVICYFHDLETGGTLIFPLIGLTFLMSHLSYKYVETPIRRSKISFKTSVLLGVIIPAIIAMGAFYVVRKFDGLPQRLGAEHARAFHTVLSHRDPMRKLCQTYSGNDIEECSFGYLNEESRRALLIGDSHASHIKGFIEVLSQDAKVKTYIQTDSACLVLAGEYDPWRDSQQGGSCLSQKLKMHGYIKNNNLDYVIISQRWLGYSQNMVAYKKSLEETIMFVKSTGSKLVLVYPVAEGGGRNINLCFYRNIDQPEVCDIKKAESDERLKEVYAMFSDLIKQYPDVISIDPQKVQCSDNVCYTQHDGIPLYQDIHHIYDYTAKKFAREYLMKFGNPLSE